MVMSTDEVITSSIVEYSVALTVDGETLKHIDCIIEVICVFVD